MRLLLLVLLYCALFFGCASSKALNTSQLEAARASLLKIDLSRVSTFTPATAKSAGFSTATEDSQLSQAFTEMLCGCKSALSGFETKATHLKYLKVAIATSGALVGGVAVPVLTTASAASNAALISGLGGFSGVANAAQQTMESEGLTSRSMLEIRSQVLNDFKSSINDYFDSNNSYPERKSAIQKALVACTMYATTVPDTETK